jgi:cell wall-associated NlpC family hydrolase
MGDDETTYQSQWPRWADEVQWSQAAPGDIVQFQAGRSVHTLILTGGNRPSTAQVVDSNFGSRWTVHRGSFQSRASSFPPDSYKIWRVRK